MEERLKHLAISSVPGDDESSTTPTTTTTTIINGGHQTTPRLPLNHHASFSLNTSQISNEGDLDHNHHQHQHNNSDTSLLSNQTTSEFKPSEHQQSSTKRSIKKKARLIFPAQQKNYGPKATLKKVTDEYLVLVQDPLSLQLSWTRAPLYVLVIKKVCDTLFEPYSDMIKYLIYNHNLIVYVEEKDYDNEIFRSDQRISSAMGPSSRGDKPSLRKFSKEVCVNRTTELNKIDFIVCLGGDGTLLHVSNLFQASCPPVLSVHMGSLGFLCPFDFDRYKEYLSGVVKGGVPLLLRNRLKCRLERSSSDKLSDSVSSLNNGVNNESTGSSTTSSSEICCNYKFMNPEEQEDINKALVSTGMLSLNEIVVSRGPSPFLTNLDLYINDYLITTVQGDGLIISTPTGSTAYAMAAGASMCHPSVQSIIIAPICPHSLSFRPIVVPAGVELKVCVSPDARHNSWFSVDGRNLTELRHGYHLSITTSEYPLPSINRSDQINDWFEGLATCLHWNQRQKQLPLNSCYLQQSLNSTSQTQLNPSTSLHVSRSSSSSSIKQQQSSNQSNGGVYHHNTNNNLNSTLQQVDGGNSLFKMMPKPEFLLDEEVNGEALSPAAVK